ncbi:hypothetical protein BDN72DRAFT_95400 [Pluteus cervinus]|uniref:Uncharacterized protein n=1 Tax=Pluteus cervinus TaxID=181527 RepID=A0ACD2ZY40_9AGAR|nr:hypothetical protein BDN72DRAFT_95400 [Pluteus cervinus]
MFYCSFPSLFPLLFLSISFSVQIHTSPIHQSTHTSKSVSYLHSTLVNSYLISKVYSTVQYEYIYELPLNFIDASWSVTVLPAKPRLSTVSSVEWMHPSRRQRHW